MADAKQGRGGRGSTGASKPSSRSSAQASSGSSSRSSAQASSKSSNRRRSTAQAPSQTEGMTPVEAVRRTRAQLPSLLGRPLEAVLGVDRDDGNWIVTAQVVELERIPSTTDVLGDYEAILDEKGEILSYRRVHRYYRGQVESMGER